MALFVDYGNPDNDQGEWVTVGTDSETGASIRFRVRPMPVDLQRQMFRKHMRSDDTISSEGVKVRQLDDLAANELARVIWCVTECEGVTVLAPDDEAAKWYGKTLGREGTIKAGDAVTLDGKLNEAIKERIFSKRQDLREQLLKEADRIAKERGTKLRSLEGNS